MSDFFADFLTDFDYPSEAAIELTEAYEELKKHNAAELNAVLEIYKESIRCDYNAILQKCEELAAASGVHPYRVKLIVFILMSEVLLERYKAAGHTYELWYDTMLDLKYKALECKAVKNIWGSFVASWFVGFFNMNRFSFGRLQCETSNFGTRYSEGDKALVETSRVIEVHIPRSLKPLSHEACLASYSAAAEFFKGELGDTPIAFVCSSWLLYPKNYDILPEHSNIRRFMDDFTILSEKTEPAGLYHDMWRLFDMDYTGDVNDYPEDSSLRRAYKKHLLHGGSTGTGYGVFFYPPKA